MPPESQRAQQLKNLVNSFPGANSQTAQQLDAARKIQMQQTIGQAPSSLASTVPAQQMGAQQVGQQASNKLQVGQEEQNQLVQAGQLGLAQQGASLRQTEADRQVSNEKQFQEFRNKLGQIDERLKNKLVDQQMSFEKDNAGRTLFNQQQLMDYAVSNAKSSAELEKYKQISSQASERKIYAMKVASSRLEQALSQEYKKGEQSMNQEQTMRLGAAARAMRDAIKKEQNDAANKAQMWTSAGAILGGIGGAIVGGPMGAAAGASVGGGIGATAAGTSPQNILGAISPASGLLNKLQGK